MNLINILSVVVDTIGKIENVIELDWLGNIIKALIEGCGSIGIGIIVFTLILKLITLPFDIFSRVSTKKNSVMMEKMRPEIEKLQRQFSNNQELYQRKLQDLYKKNGYSPLSACLPTLLNLVVFIIVIGQFSTYSNYANFDVFCNMSVAYEQAIDNCSEDYVIKVESTDENGNLKVTRYLNLYNYFINSEYNGVFKIEQNNKYDAVVTFGTGYSQEQLNERYALIYSEIEKGTSGALTDYIIAEDGDIYLNENNEYVLSSELDLNVVASQIVNHYAKVYVNQNIKGFGREAAAEVFRNTELSFLWVKNIWSQDLPWEHPVKSTFAEYGFVKSSGCIASCKASCSGADNSVQSVSEEQYAELTGALEKEKSQANGYIILVILSIGTMLLSQIVLQKQNKTQMELSTVDGENGTAAQSQKMMTWMMPVMFGIFSFMYTASFSIYIVVSSVFGLASTLIINKLVDKKFERLAAKEAKEMELKRTGRINEINKDKKGKNNKK